MLFTKGATEDGSVMVSHSDDNEVGDQRIVYVGAKTYPKGAKRPVFLEKQMFPRYVGTDRGDAYHLAGYPPSKPVGFIDQVEKTYAYLDANYGVINEHLLAIGECTNSTHFYFAAPGPTRLFGIAELSRIALERCKRAKEAVLLIGKLAEQRGYYGWGETLLLADPDEGWVFEISCAPDGKSALWVAKRVPDGEIFVAANQFRIQEIDPQDPTLLYSSNLFRIAQEQNVLEKGKPLNWLRLICPGEFDHPYYSLRRVWRVQSRLNPDLNLSPWVEDAFTSYYPFSVKPKKRVRVEEVFALYRDHYEGTEFDLTKGVAAGPYSSPARFIGSYDRTDFPNKRKTPLPGAWERAISIYYTGYTYVAQLRKELPKEIGGVVWVGFDEPYTSCFMPIYSGVSDLPRSFQYGSPKIYTPDFAWWPFNFVANWIRSIYSYSVKDVVKKQKELEDKEREEALKLEKELATLWKKQPGSVKERATQFCLENAQTILKQWNSLRTDLIEKYNDGYDNKPEPGGMIGYPQEWLDRAGYAKGPISYQKDAGGDKEKVQ